MTTPKTVIDESVLAELKATAGDEFVGELIDTFLEEGPQMLAQLREALGSGAADTFKREAHSLKTNAHTFGAMALGAHARELELGGLPGDDTGLQALEGLYSEAAAALAERRHG